MNRSFQYFYVDSVRECCNIVENILLTQSVIGLDCEGVFLSKEGQLTLLQISLSDKVVFVFDILKGGKEMFDGLEKENKRGLRHVLEKRSILKLIHDCRNDWASLLHQYQVRIYNFIDTQEAYFIYKLFYDSEITLPLSLLRFIEYFSGKKLAHKKNFKHLMTENPALWGTRPLTEEQIQYASEDVAYLIDAWNSINQYFNKNLKELVYFTSILKVVEISLFDEFKQYLISHSLFLKQNEVFYDPDYILNYTLNLDYIMIFLKLKSFIIKDGPSNEYNSQKNGYEVIQSVYRYKNITNEPKIVYNNRNYGKTFYYKKKKNYEHLNKSPSNNSTDVDSVEDCETKVKKSFISKPKKKQFYSNHWQYVNVESNCKLNIKH